MSFHVEDAGDGVTLSKGRKRSDQFSSMVQVATVCAIEPHVRGRVVVVISDRPARNTNTCAFIASILFGNGELGRHITYSVSYHVQYCNQGKNNFVLTLALTFQMKQPDLIAVVVRP